jgi:multidrug efflux pump subunit AcrA (membrane-fusion protein)
LGKEPVLNNVVTEQKKRSKTPARAMAIGMIALAATLVLAGTGSFLSNGEPETDDSLHVVKRGNLQALIQGDGTLEPIRKHVSENEYRYSTKVLFALPEGAIVKEGDLVLELDATYVSDRLERQELDVEESKFLLEQAKETLSIEKSSVEGRIRAAKLKLEFARTDLEQYVDGLWPQSERNYEMAIQQVQEELLLAKDQLEWSEKLEDAGFETKKKLAEQNLQVTQFSAKLDKANETLRIARTYDHPAKKRKLESIVQESEIDLEREGYQGAARIAKYQGSLKKREYHFDNEMDRLEWYQKQVEVAKVRAKADGMVVYPLTRYSSSQGMIEAGVTVYFGQALVEIPDTSKMKVAFMVHESDAHRVSLGQAAQVELGTYNGQIFNGRVATVGLTPDRGTSYYRPELKVYRTEVVIEDELPEVKPGMSGSVTIEIARLENVLTVPLQAVTSVDGLRVCLVSVGEEQVLKPVKTGVFNDQNIEIVSGLKEGDIVSLSPPVGQGALEMEVIHSEAPDERFEERDFSSDPIDADADDDAQLNVGG